MESQLTSCPGFTGSSLTIGFGRGLGGNSAGVSSALALKGGDGLWFVIFAAGTSSSGLGEAMAAFGNVCNSC